jgi:hypothetical protein
MIINSCQITTTYNKKKTNQYQQPIYQNQNHFKQQVLAFQQQQMKQNVTQQQQQFAFNNAKSGQLQFSWNTAVVSTSGDDVNVDLFDENSDLLDQSTIQPFSNPNLS